MSAEIEGKDLCVKKLTIELEEVIRVDRIREGEIKDLMRENERLYNEVSAMRHQLHQLAISYNFVV